jgi:hypothetical protein
MKHVQTARVPLVTQAGEGVGEAEIAYGYEAADRSVLRLWNGEVDFTEEATDFFEAFCKVRLKLETRGLLVATYGGSRTVFPSGMCRDMGGGLSAYRHSLGQPGGLECLVRIFDTGPDVEPATVAQQRAFVDQWISSIGIPNGATESTLSLEAKGAAGNTFTPGASRTLSISWAPVAVVLLHSVLAGLIGHRRDLDTVFHFLGGVAGAYAACQALVLVPRLASRFAARHARFLAVAAVAIVAVLWECTEFASDRLLGSHIQHGWLDTMMDLALGSGGAVIGAILGAASQREVARNRG